MCKGKERMAGMIRQRQAESQAVHVAGFSGMMMVRYVGRVQRALLPESLFSGVRYGYGTEQPLFYIDARDAGRVLGWTEDGERVFMVAGTNGKETS